MCINHLECGSEWVGLGVDIIEDSRLDARSLLSSMRHHRPAHFWNTNTLMLGIGMHALNKLMTTCTSTFALRVLAGDAPSTPGTLASSWVFTWMLVWLMLHSFTWRGGWNGWTQRVDFCVCSGPGLELVRSEVAQEESWRSPCAIGFVGRLRLRWHQARHQLAHKALILFSANISISIHSFNSPAPMYILADFPSPNFFAH